MARRTAPRGATGAAALVAAVVSSQRCEATILASRILGRSLLGERSPRLRCDLQPGHDGPHTVTIGDHTHRW